MTANGNHREWVWDAQVSPVIRAVGFIFNEPAPAKSLATVGVEGKGQETSLHPMLPRAVSRDLTPMQACLSLISHHARVKSREVMPQALQ